MSTSTYYNFINLTAEGTISHTPDATTNSIEAHRQTPESIETSQSDSSSSLNQFDSSKPRLVASSATNYIGSSSSSSASSSSALSMASSTNLMTTANSTTPTAPRVLTASLLDRNKNIGANGSNKITNKFSHNHRDLQRQASETPTMQSSQLGQLTHSYTLHSLEPRPLKPFKSKSAYIEAMKEDLSEWLNRLYSDLELNTDDFFSQLETGAIICRHANNVTQMGRNSMLEQATNDSGGSSSNDNSLTHETNQQIALLSSPSPECDEHHHHHHQQQQVSANNSFDQQQHHHHNQQQHHQQIITQPLSYRHRHSTANSSISSIATSSSSASRQRLSLTGSSALLSPRKDRVIDWFRVKMISYKSDARAGTFFARDNICQFILWCRSLHIRDCLLFETDDLVARKNEKSFILCLLEVARIGFKVGMPTPLIIQLEQEIDREIENEAKLQHRLEEEKQLDFSPTCGEAISLSGSSCNEENNNNHIGDNLNIKESHESQPPANDVSPKPNEIVSENEEQEEDCEQDYGPKPQVITNDLLSLHEKVVQLLCQCTCPTQFPMVRIGDGKYKVGDKLIIFVRILRRHIMVRVGGGWQELSEFLRQKDPCRTKHHHSMFSSHNNQAEHISSTLAPLATSNVLPITTSAVIHSTRIPTLTHGPISSKSRLLSSNCNLNKGYTNHSRNVAGQKLISSSLSMSWLSHNS